MSHPQVLILGYSEAAMYLQQPEARDVAAVIAIAGQREHTVDTKAFNHALVLHFDDTESPAPDDLLAQARLSMRQRAARDIGLHLNPPRPDDVAAILAFARDIQSLDGTLLCHCHAGISRSPAVALICLTLWRGPGSEAASMSDVRRARTAAVPHLGLIRFADQALSRDGALLRAVTGE